SRSGTAAGSLGRNKGHVARQRRFSFVDAVHFTIGAMSPRAVERPIDRSASPSASLVREPATARVRKRASASRAAAVLILPNAHAASASTVGGVSELESNESSQRSEEHTSE